MGEADITSSLRSAVRDATGLMSEAASQDVGRRLEAVAHAILRESCTELTFLVMGKTGVGKSTLINSLVGSEVCATGEALACTTKTTLIEVRKVNGINVNIYDTQGFLDGKNQEEDIFESIRGKRMNLLILCVSMVGRAEQEDSKCTISYITEVLGIEIWERAVIVLTQANERVEEIAWRRKNGRESTSYTELVHTFITTLRGYLANAKSSEGQQIPPEVIAGIPFVPAGVYLNGREELRGELPDCDDWITRFWVCCFQRCERTARTAFLSVASPRLRLRNDGSTDPESGPRSENGRRPSQYPSPDWRDYSDVRYIIGDIPELDVPVLEKVARAVGAAVRAPGTLAGGIVGAAVGGIRKLAK